MGLSGNDIPLSARIMALAEVYDAMTSKRCYNEAASHKNVSHMIIKEKGKHFDPKIVDAFVQVEKEWLNIKDRLKD
ncbi:response regulator [Candidatus Magnetomorum sp. HK-1]|nr:response regulator [Candidatus Magnetomorum sp. HK-1]